MTRLVGEWTEKNCGDYTTEEIVNAFFEWVDRNEDFTPSEEAKRRLTEFVDSNPIIRYMWDAATDIGYDSF